jgi:hypothetical protein
VSAARSIAGLEKIADALVEFERVAQGLDPVHSRRMRVELAEIQKRANLSANEVLLLKEWTSPRTNVVPFRPKAAGTEEAAP